MKSLFWFLVGLFLSGISYAQQDAQYTQYMFNTVAVNPGYTGTRDALSILALHRSQWIGFPGAPVTQTISGNAPVYDKRLGLGISFNNDKAGPVRQSGFFADVSYRLRFEKSNLSFGIKSGLDLYQARIANLALVSVTDDQFKSDLTSRLLPNFGAGAYYYSDRWYLGLSTPRLVQNSVDVNTGSVSTEKLAMQKMHWFFIGGMVVDINPFIRFKPAVMAKVTGGAPVSVDITGNFFFYDRLWLGAMYRGGDAVGILAQFQFNSQLRAGYSFDYTVSKLRTYNSGTHEVMIGYDFSFAKEKIKSPRYF